MNDAIKEYLRQNYGTMAKYCEIAGLDPKSFNSLLSRDLSGARLDTFRKWLGAAGIDMNHFAETGEVRRYRPAVEKESTVPIYKEGNTLMDFRLGEGIGGFKVERFSGEQADCRFATEVPERAEGVFVVRGILRLGFPVDGDTLITRNGKIKLDAFSGASVVGVVI